MPTSPSRKASAKPAPPRPTLIRPFIAIVILAVALVAVIALPASLVSHFLPSSIHADDFSGSLWHGSAGRITVNSRDAGALEWRLHPASLLAATVSADLHWVKAGFVADASVDIDRHTVHARAVQGGGPIDDLSDLKLAADWHGAAHFDFSELTLSLGTDSLELRSAVGELDTSGLSSAQVADGANLGGYALHLADGAITPDTDATAELTDTGGPLELRATLHFSPKDHIGMLSGTLKDRPEAPPALRSQVDALAQLHARDAKGRVPVELEFTL